MTFAHFTDTFTGNPALGPGAAITAGFSNADGTIVALGGALTHDTKLLEVTVSCPAGATQQTAVDTSMLLDILIDPAGGTSWDTTNPLIEGLMCGYMGVFSTSSWPWRRWLFPVDLPAGVALAGRARSNAASGAVEISVKIIAHGGADNPRTILSGQKIDAIGQNRAASGGTSIQANASANTYGSWTSIGAATVRRYKALIASVCALGAAAGTGNNQIQIGISSVAISPIFTLFTNSAESCSDLYESKIIYRDIPEGAQLQARTRYSAAGGPALQTILHGVY